MALLEPRDRPFETFITMMARQPAQPPCFPCELCAVGITGRFHVYWEEVGDQQQAVLLHATCAEKFAAAMGAPSKPPCKPAAPPAGDGYDSDPWGNPYF